jgi:hypothetical protein
MGLNNIAKQGWDYINNIAKNISVEGMQKGWDTYITRSPEELANVARASMQRQNTILSNLEMDKMNNLFASIDKSNADLVKETSKLQNAISAGNSNEAMSIANNINDRFQDNKFLNLLTDAEGKYNKIESAINNLSANKVKENFIETRKEKITNNKLLSNFVDDGGKLADLNYKLNPRGIPAYFTTDDPKKNRIRAGVAAGAYMGGSMVVRGIQGGNPITNEYGERDIAGIPFI